MSSTCCLDCRHYLTDCCNNPESENYGLEVEPFDGCEEGSVEPMSEEICKDYKYDPKFDKEWKDAVAPFKKVEWVPKDSGEGRKLEVSK